MNELIIQSSFQFGEVSDLLHSQVKSGIYYRAARRLRNVLVIPQGGVRKRFGTGYDYTFSATDYTQVNPFLISMNGIDRYLIVFANLEILIFYQDALVATVVSTYTGAEVADLSVTHNNDFIVIAHPNHFPATLYLVSAPGTWTLDAAPVFIHYPTYDFLSNYADKFFAVNVVSSGAALTTATNLLGQIVTLSADSGTIFTANHVGGLYYGDSGTIRITGFTDATHVTGYITQTFDPASSLFYAPNNISGEVSVLTEIAFSSTRGYPQITTFYQNRLVFAVTNALLNGVWLSNFNGFNKTTFLFNDSQALDTSAISTLISGTKGVVIQHVLSFQTLIVMTNTGIYTTPLLDQLPLTPSNIAFINKRSSDGSSDVEPVVFDNGVIYFVRGGKRVKSLVINQTGVAYDTHDISVLASHLVDQPYSAAIFQNSSDADGNWLFMTNTGSVQNGNLSVYQQVPEQEITAWSMQTTDGKFRWVTSNDDFVYFIVERVINNVTKLFLEYLDFSLNTDSAYTNTYMSPTSTITGLSYLEGKTVVVIGDGAVMEPRVVTSGQIVLEYPVMTIEVGLPFYPLIRPMPINVPTSQGDDLYLPTSIKSMYIDFYQSLGITLNGTVLLSTEFDEDHYDTPIIPKTGVQQLMPMGGWDSDAIFDISQVLPYPFTIVGIGFSLNI